MASSSAFENLVELHYAGLFRFALSLTASDAEASDLVQETFHTWAEKGHQLRDSAKAKTWLYTTLHREFLASHRRVLKFPQEDLDDVDAELPEVRLDPGTRLDASAALDALTRLDPLFRAPVALFYLEDYALKEIAATLDLPVGTVKSRISRGLARLQAALLDVAKGGATSSPVSHG